MAKAEKLPSGTWRVRVQYYDELGNRHHKSITGKTEAEALYKAEKESKKLQFSKTQRADITLKEAAERFICENETLLSPTTLRGYRQIPVNYFPDLFRLKVCNIDNKAIQKAINADSTHSPKSLKNAIGFVSVVLKKFNEDLTINVKFPKKSRKILPIPTLEEIGVILKACEDSNIEIAVKLAVYLGMRMSEIAGVRFSDVKNGKIYIHNVVVYSGNGFVEKEMTKNDSSTRVVSLPEHLYKRIQAEPRDSEDEKICKWKPSTIYNSYQRLLKECNLPHYRFHDLRHFNASIMLRLNIPTKYQMSRGGWSTDSTLKTVYQHTMTDYESEVDKQLYTFIDELKCDTQM